MSQRKRRAIVSDDEEDGDGILDLAAAAEMSPQMEVEVLSGSMSMRSGHAASGHAVSGHAASVLASAQFEPAPCRQQAFTKMVKAALQKAGTEGAHAPVHATSTSCQVCASTVLYCIGRRPQAASLSVACHACAGAVAACCCTSIRHIIHAARCRGNLPGAAGTGCTCPGCSRADLPTLLAPDTGNQMHVEHADSQFVR